MEIFLENKTMKRTHLSVFLEDGGGFEASINLPKEEAEAYYLGKQWYSGTEGGVEITSKCRFVKIYREEEALG